MFSKLRLSGFAMAVFFVIHMFSPAALAVEGSQTSLDSDSVFHIVNNYRLKAGLPTFVKDQWLCELAQSRRAELHGEIFEGKGIHSGLRKRALPFWVTENMKLGSSEGEVVSWWLHSPIHRKALYSNHPYSCGVCEGRICIQLFTSFIPKKN